jgi:hypothetical protein
MVDDEDFGGTVARFEPEAELFLIRREDRGSVCVSRGMGKRGGPLPNHRIVAFDGAHVTFRWRDHAHGNKQRLMPTVIARLCFLSAANSW